MMIRVLIADDHPAVRSGLKAILTKAEDIELVGEAGDGQEAVRLAQQLQPDVVVLDITMPRLNGFQAIAQLRRVGVATEVVILSVHNEEALVQQALQHGAVGYVLKHSSTAELIQAIRSAQQGQRFFSSSLRVPSGVIILPNHKPVLG
jgi:DNA-binding NarL/FixJ family response regulator